MILTTQEARRPGMDLSIEYVIFVTLPSLKCQVEAKVIKNVRIKSGLAKFLEISKQ